MNSRLVAAKGDVVLRFPRPVLLKFATRSSTDDKMGGAALMFGGTDNVRTVASHGCMISQCIRPILLRGLLLAGKKF